MPAFSSFDPQTMLEGAEQDRVYFSPGNPWPQGHAVDNCYLDGKLFEDNTLQVNLHLSSVDYRENDGGDFLDEGTDSDWGAKVVWNNYHSFSIDGTVATATEHNPFSMSAFVPTLLRIDELPGAYQRFLDDELDFVTVVLGHDSVADHTIKIGEERHGNFPIAWTARIALSYSGEETFDHSFAVETKVRAFDDIYVIGDRADDEVIDALRAVLVEHEEFEIQRHNGNRYIVRKNRQPRAH